MLTYQNDPIVSRTNTETPEGFNFGVYGESTLFNGVRGVTYAPGHGAVVGVSENHTPQASPGVFGQSDGTGVWGTSKTWMGVYGNSESTTGGAGVMGEGDPGPGVIGKSTKWVGVYGETAGIENGPAGVWGEHKGAGIGVKAVSKDGVGLAAYSTSNEAIHAETKSPTTAAIAAYNLNPNGTGAAIFAKKEGTQGHAGFFDGNVWIGGELAVGEGLKVRGLSIDGLVGRVQALEGLVGRVQAVEGLAGRVQALEQKIAALESNQNTAVSNLTGRITQAEFAISDLRAKVQQIIAALGGTQ